MVATLGRRLRWKQARRAPGDWYLSNESVRGNRRTGELFQACGFSGILIGGFLGRQSRM